MLSKYDDDYLRYESKEAQIQASKSISGNIKEHKFGQLGYSSAKIGQIEDNIK